MGDYDFDRLAARRFPVIKRLSSLKAGSSRADYSSKGASIGASSGSIFNQVKASKSTPRREPVSDPRLARLADAVDDNETSAFTLYSLSDASREIQEANVSASAASMKEVEAAVRLAEELRQRIVESEQSATEAQAEKLSLATVERLLRS